jgi:ComF family protein
VTAPAPALARPADTLTGNATAARRRWPVPTQCELCRAWADDPLCGACRQRFTGLRPRCARCALPLGTPAPACGECLTDPPPFDATVCAVDYVFPWDGLIQAFKFQQRVDLARPLAGLLAEAVRRAALPRPAWVLPVPLSRERLVQRGYDQVALLARPLARRLGGHAAPAVREDLLQRVVDTPPQAGLDRTARQHNLRAAFWVPAAAQASVRGSHLALVDDVMTTGATLRAAATVLRRAGAASVQAWVLARTP